MMLSPFSDRQSTSSISRLPEKWRKQKAVHQLVETIHKNSLYVTAQLSHAGETVKSEITGKPVLGASAAAMPRTGYVPREMSLAYIKKVIDDFAAAAVQAKKAGFDGIEIHSAHGYLLNQFFLH